jgi:hypothetical protein
MVGIATVYTLALQPLYCGGIYSTHNSPWIAVDVSQYKTHSIRLIIASATSSPNRRQSPHSRPTGGTITYR